MKKEPEKAEPVAVTEERIPGQMEVADYPELMPERTEEENECNDGNTGRNPESISGSGEQGKTNDKGHGVPADEQETPQSNEKSSEKENYKEVRQAARDRLDAVHAVFWGWENEKTIPKEELEMALKNAKNLVNAIETLILMTGEQ